MNNPAYKVRIGDETFDSASNPEILSISVDLDLDVPADCFEICLKPSSKASSLQVGDPVVLELGYQSSLSKVLTGAVHSVEANISQITVKGLSLVSLLSHMKVNQVYEKQTAGAIVKDLAEKMGIAVVEAEDGLSLPMYVVDDGKDAFCHMKDLARRCGFDLFLKGDGRLVFKRYARQTPRQFRYGRDVIEAEAEEPRPMASCVKVFGESPSGFRGAETAHWSSKKVVEGIAGSGEAVICIEDPAVRDKDTADKVASAILESLTTPLFGRLKALGNARLGLGDTIEIIDMPENRLNGEFEAVRVAHHYSKKEGFTSQVDWVKRVSRTASLPPVSLAAARPIPLAPPSPLEEQLERAESDLDDSRTRLQYAAEAAETELEASQSEIIQSMAQQDQMGKELISAAEEAKRVAAEAAGEMLAKAEELLREIEAKKGEMEEDLAQAKAKVEEFKGKATARLEGYQQEMKELEEKAKKGIEEARKKFAEEMDKVEETRKGLPDQVDQAKGELEKGKAKVEEERGKLEALQGEMAQLSGPALSKAKLEADKVQSSVAEAEEKAGQIEKDLEAKAKELEGAASEVEKVEEKINKEFEERSKEARARLDELEGQVGEAKKEMEDVERELLAKEEEGKKKIEEMAEKVKSQVEEAKTAGEKLVGEAEEKLEKAKEKVETVRRQALEGMEKAKKAYGEARDKVMEARSQAGLE